MDGLQVIVHTQSPRVVGPRRYVLRYLISQTHVYSHYCHERCGGGGSDASREKRAAERGYRYDLVDIIDEAQCFTVGVCGKLERLAHFFLSTVEILPRLKVAN